MPIPVLSKLFGPERHLGNRFYRNSFEFVAWRYQDCREKVTTIAVQSVLLLVLDAAMIMLAMRTMRVMQSPAARGNDGGMFGLTMGVIAVGLVLSVWRLWRNTRRFLTLQGEIRELQTQAGDAPV
ncbi:MAG: hypothetical protein ACYDIE_00265 [Candidatus Krumholzibacteriia bacterium]